MSFNVEGKRVLVVGLGISGFATARALVELNAKVRVTESGSSDAISQRSAALSALGVEVETGGHDLDRLDADLAIVSPGIPLRTPVVEGLVAGGVEIASEIEIAYRLAECDLLAITGTNGKTTTTSLLAAMLQESGIPSTAAGNIGYPLIEAIASVGSGGAIAVEVSSFQLALTRTFRPKIAVLLNVAEDHTDWHGTFEDYVDAKARIVANQESDDVFLPNDDDPIALRVASKARSALRPFSARRVPEGGVGVDRGLIVFNEQPVVSVADVPLPGRAGLEDAVAATGAALSYGIEARVVARAIKGFRPLAHRLEIVAEARGVTYIDDSKATNPHATLSAVRGLHDIVLIAGGRSKGIDLSSLASTVPPVTSVVALGEAREEVAAVFAGVVPVQIADSMEDAVRAAAREATSGGSVLLSPGCASLDMYESYVARGEDFARAVAKVIGEGEGGGDGDA
jgi:UDP-N-acetylmuramoylalanine--D-glutamate ligase